MLFGGKGKKKKQFSITVIVIGWQIQGWIPLRVCMWQVCGGNVILSASPVRSLQMQIPVAAVFYDICSCSPGWPRQASRRGLANQDRKREMGGQVGPLSCQRCPPFPFFSSPLLSYWSQLCHLCSHQSFSLPHPSPRLSLSVLDEDITPQPLPDTSASASFCQWFSPRSLMFQSELGQRASYSLYRCLLHARERDRDSYEVTSL